MCLGGIDENMTQEERWIVRYNEVMKFIEDNKRRPSKYNLEERNAWNWLRHTQKQLGAGELKPERVEMFKKLLELAEQYKRVNQWK
jgi:hypothetical protein